MVDFSADQARDQAAALKNLELGTAAIKARADAMGYTAASAHVMAAYTAEEDALLAILVRFSRVAVAPNRQ